MATPPPLVLPSARSSPSSSMVAGSIPIPISITSIFSMPSNSMEQGDGQGDGEERLRTGAGQGDREQPGGDEQSCPGVGEVRKEHPGGVEVRKKRNRNTGGASTSLRSISPQELIVTTAISLHVRS